MDKPSNKKIIEIHKKYKCAPNIYYNKKNIFSNEYDGSVFGTCFSKDHLINMINAYQKSYPNDILFKENNIKNIPKNELWNTLNSRLKDKCRDETCWTNLNFIKNIPYNTKNDIKNYTFKPPRPISPSGDDTNVWLSNVDIERVMKQYEKIYDDFEFLGPYPIDFAKYFNSYKFDVNVIKRLRKSGINRIGIVFNTGTLESGGRHWVALFMDFKNKNWNDSYTIEYFDSVGSTPPNEITNLINTIIRECCQSNECIRINDYVKQLQHQNGDSECGVYAIYFITERLKGRTYNDIQSNEIHDDIMYELRNKFFKKI